MSANGQKLYTDFWKFPCNFNAIKEGQILFVTEGHYFTLLQLTVWEALHWSYVIIRQYNLTVDSPCVTRLSSNKRKVFALKMSWKDTLNRKKIKQLNGSKGMSNIK